MRTKGLLHWGARKQSGGARHGSHGSCPIPSLPPCFHPSLGVDHVLPPSTPPIHRSSTDRSVRYMVTCEHACYEVIGARVPHLPMTEMPPSTLTLLGDLHVPQIQHLVQLVGCCCVDCFQDIRSVASAWHIVRQRLLRALNGHLASCHPAAYALAQKSRKSLGCPHDLVHHGCGQHPIPRSPHGCVRAPAMRDATLAAKLVVVDNGNGSRASYGYDPLPTVTRPQPRSLFPKVLVPSAVEWMSLWLLSLFLLVLLVWRQQRWILRIPGMGGAVHGFANAWKAEYAAARRAATPCSP